MSVTAAQLIARVSVEGAAASEGQLIGLGRASDDTQARFGKLAQVGAGLLVAGLVVAGAASVKMAADFQQGVNRLRTGAGDIQDSFATLSRGILGVSVATGQMTGPLTSAMYLILSSGQRGALAFSTLAAAAKGAVIEQANVTDVANTLSGVMTNYGTKVFGASQYMNGLITAVSLGKITLQDLAVAMGPIDPIAKSVGIRFSDLAAAMSTQTNAMIPAARAATGLRFMMLALENPTDKAKSAMTALGLDSVAVANEMKVSLPGALQMIVQAALKVGPEGSVPFNRAVSDMVGGIRSFTAFTALTGPHMAAFIKNSKDIAASMRSGAGDVNGWALAQSNFNVILDKGKAALVAAAIGLGTLLLPALGHLVSLLPGIIGYFTDFSGHAGTIVPILAGIGTTIALILVPAVWSLAAGVIAATWPVLAIGAAVAGLVAIFMHFYQTNAGFKSFIDNLVVGFKQVASYVVANFIPAIKEMSAWFQANVLPVLAQIGQFLAGTFVPVWQQLVDTWNSQILPALKQLWVAIQPLMPVFKLLGEILVGVVIVAVVALALTLAGMAKLIAIVISDIVAGIGFVATAINAIGPIFSAVGTAVHGSLTFIKNTVGGAFDWIGTHVHDALSGVASFSVNTWNGIVSFVKSIPSKIQEALSTLGALLLAPFKWLYDHNYYVKDFVEGAKLALTALRDIVGSLFDSMGTTIRDVLTGIKNVVGTIFDWIGTHVRDILTGIKNFVGTIFDAIGTLIRSKLTDTKNATGGIFDALGSAVRSKLTDLKNAVGGIFDSLGTLMHQKLTDAWNGLVSFASGWPSQAFQWGVNLVTGLVNGLLSMLGRVKDVAGQIAGAIGNFLGFHSPAKEGPGRDADKWAPAFVNMYAQGLIAGAPKVQAALARLLQPGLALSVAHSVSGALGSAVGSGASVFSGGVLSGVAMAGMRGGQPTIIVQVQQPDMVLDGVRLSRGLMPHITNAVRYGVGGFGR